MKISVVIITYNEERNIERCLKSVKDIADEIVVVDSLSDDKTKLICERYNAHFLENKFPGHIEQKNFGMDKAAFNTILSLDADEALSNTLRKSIQEIKNKDTGQTVAFSMNRKTNYCGQWINHSGWYPDRKIRLWNRQYGRWGGINPHDKIVLSGEVKVIQLTGDLLHYSFYSIEEHITQINKFTTISAKAMKDRNKNIVFVKMLFSPLVRFIRDYVFKGGFRDGLFGFIICKNSAYSRFLRYAKLYHLLLNKKNKN